MIALPHPLAKGGHHCPDAFARVLKRDLFRIMDASIKLACVLLEQFLHRTGYINTRRNGKSKILNRER